LLVLVGFCGGLFGHPVVVGGDGACLAGYGRPGDGAGVIDADFDVTFGDGLVPGAVLRDQGPDLGRACGQAGTCPVSVRPASTWLPGPVE